MTTDLATAQADAQRVIKAYDSAVVLATAAEIAYPQYADQIAAAITEGNTVVAQLQPLLTDSSADAASIEALVARVLAQEAALATSVKG